MQGKIETLFFVHCWILTLSFYPVELQQLTVKEYLDIVTVYSTFRHISIWTHISCFAMDEHLTIATKLAAARNIQSRFITKFDNNFHLMDTPAYTFQGYVVDMHCDNVFSIFQKEDHQLLFKNNNFWLILDNLTESIAQSNTDENSLRSKRELESLDMLPISEVVLVRRGLSNNEWLIFDTYKIAPNYPLEIALFGWILLNSNHVESRSEIEGLQLSTKFQLKLSRKNLHGLELRCAIVITYPERFTYMEDVNNAHIDVTTKSTYPIMVSLSKDLNFTCNIFQTDSYGWLINGTWDGAMGLYQRNQVDLLFHGTSMRADRLSYTEFTADLFFLETPFIFRQLPLASNSNIFVLPLNAQVWRCCFIAMIIVVVIMLTQLMHSTNRRQISCLDVISFVWGAVCQQGTHLLITNTSGRFIVLTTFLTSLAIFVSYSASIVVLLQSSSHAIKNIDDLLASPLKLALQEAKYNRFNYLFENVSILNKVYEKKIKPMGKHGWVYDPYAGVEKVRTEPFAFQVESASAYKAVAKTYTENEKCSLTEIHLLRVPLTTATIARNSPYKELIKQRIRFQRENGLMNREKRRWFPKKPICEGNSHSVTAVGLTEIRAAILIWIIGTGLSLLMLSIEILSRHVFKL